MNRTALIKGFLGVITIATSSSVLANAPVAARAPHSPKMVPSKMVHHKTTPACPEIIQPQRLWEISITGGAFKPNVTNTQFAVNDQAIVVGPPSGETLRNHPSSRFFWGLNLGHRFCDSNDNLNATYQMGTSKDTNSFSGTLAPTINPGIYGIVSATSASSEFRYNYHFANIELGSLLDNCGNLMINPAFGVTYYDVKSDQLVNFYILNEIRERGTTRNSQISKKSKFEGIGPSLGVNLTYPIGCWGFSIVSNNRYSALFGKMHNEYFGFYRDSSGVNQGTPFNMVFNNKRDLANLLQSELGLAYDISGGCDYSGRILLGYQFKLATDTFEDGQYPDDAATSLFLVNKGNTGDQGPFLRLTVAF